MSDVEPVHSLRAAEAALRSADYDRALHNLGAAWICCRARPISRLIEDLVAQLGTAGVNLDAILDGTVRDVVVRVASLAAAGPDPLVALCFARLVTEVPRDGSSMGKVWTLCHRYLRAHGDARALDIVEAGRSAARISTGGSTFRARLRRQLDVTFEAMRADPRTSDRLEPDAIAIVERMAELLASGPAQRSASWLRAIHEDPDDLELRRVYADSIAELGDPRGEFINLQLAAPDQRSRARERELLAEHAAIWAGDVGRGMVRSTWAFERGFLVAGRYREYWINEAERILADPGWALVERIENLRRIAWELPLPNLREVSGDMSTVLERDLPLPRLERLRTSSFAFSPLARARIEAGIHVPRLRDIHLDFRTRASLATLDWMFTGPFAERLHSLTLAVDAGGAFPDWVHVLEVGAPLPVLRLRDRGVEFELRHVDDVRLAHLRVRPYQRLIDLDALRGQLERFTSHPRYPILELELAPKLRDDPALRELAKGRTTSRDSAPGQS